MKLAPNVFWAMTLAEFQFAVRGHFGVVGADPAMRRTELASLMQQFPDGAKRS